MRSRYPRVDQSSKVSRRRKQLLWTLLAAITVLAIVIPLAVMFGKKKKTPPQKSSVLVPLYVYPAPGAWEPLFTAYATNISPSYVPSAYTRGRISSHPTLNFTVVVNPASGPGPGAGPDANYTREIPRLNAYANVRTVGYVSTDYTKRDLGAILRDVKVYSAWSENATIASLGMRGIFLDETPSQYDDASARVLETTAASIRSSTGFGTNPLVSELFSSFG
jgi:hypothetical protein